MPPPFPPGLATPPQRIGVLRALQLGDLLCAAPTLRALRHAWRGAEITLIGLPWAREFAERFRIYIDRFVEFPGYPGLPERTPDLARLPEFFCGQQRAPFDLLVQLHGSGRYVNEFVALCGPRQSAGFFVPGEYCPNSEMFRRWPEQGLEIHRLLSLVEFLGLPTQGDALELPLAYADFAAADEVARAGGLTSRAYAVIHPGASVPARRWPTERFAAVAESLAERGLEIVLTGTPGERPLTAQVAAAMRRSPATRRTIDLAGQTTLGTLGALVARATLVVCNDTGVSHVAAATRTPSVVISTGDQPARWAPTDRRLHHVCCRPHVVSVEEVVRAADRLLPDAAAPAKNADAAVLADALLAPPHLAPLSPR